MSLIWLLLLSGKKMLLLARDAEREELLHFHVEKKREQAHLFIVFCVVSFVWENSHKNT